MSRPATSSTSSGEFLPGSPQIACGFARIACRSTRPRGPRAGRLPRGLTLIELLIATTLTLMMMGAVVTVFAMVASSVNDSRSTMLMTDRLRSTVLLLQTDLAGATAVPMTPPLRPEDEKGYFEILQGAAGVSNTTGDQNPFSANPSPFVDKSQPACGWIPWGTSSNSNPNGTPPDATCGEADVLLFTTRSPSAPFTGRCGTTGNTPGGTPTYIQSPVAEVAWFLRGRTLYRRVLLVAPWAASWINSNLTPNASLTGGSPFYQYYDLSVNYYDPGTGSERLPGANNINHTAYMPNSLGDLTKRENRFMHANNNLEASFPPFPWPTVWGAYVLPTLAECSALGCNTNKGGGSQIVFDPYWVLPGSASPGSADLWSNVQADRVSVDPPSAGFVTTAGTRTAEDVVLTNVLSFDVKVWDPGAPIFSWKGAALAPDDPGYGYLLAASSGASVLGVGAYVNLGYHLPAGYTPPSGAPLPVFACQNYNGLTPGSSKYSNLTTAGPLACYDTWSTHYNQGFFNYYGSTTLAYLGCSSTGLDENGYGMANSPWDRDSKPPYPYPLRGIQVSVRAFDPDSRQVRQITIVQEFLPQ